MRNQIRIKAMTERSKEAEADGGASEKKVGGAEGGADTNGPGNILGGVQPSNENDGRTERRHD